MSRPIKSESADSVKDPFYLIQSNGPNKRYVLSLRDKTKISTFMAGFIDETESEVQIRIRDLDELENPTEYSGEANKSRLHEMMAKHDEVIYHHGKYDFMLRNPDTGDYIAFDEHGLLFIYTDQDYSEALDNLGAEHRPDESLIYEFDHWHIGLPDGQEKLEALIKELDLVKD